MDDGVGRSRNGGCVFVDQLGPDLAVVRLLQPYILKLETHVLSAFPRKLKVTFWQWLTSITSAAHAQQFPWRCVINQDGQRIRVDTTTHHHADVDITLQSDRDTAP